MSRICAGGVKMKTYFALPLLTASIAGCAGLDITPISPAEEAAAHAGRSDVKGYIVYAPMVVVEISQKELCNAQDAKGACKGTSTTTCSAGAPFLLPDASRPFLVNVRSGFGKTGVEVAITNGWQLGNIKDNSDNTALLGTLEKLLPLLGARSITGEAPTGQCKAPGLYRVNLAPAGVTLSPLLIY
jgi:hypothetical protein